MKIGLAQINSHLGNFQKNFDNCAEQIKKATDENVNILIFPELTIFGYHPMDMLEREQAIEVQLDYVNKIQKLVPANMAVLVGAITLNKKKGRPYYNSAVLFQKGKKPTIFNKELHPTYDVFDDGRHFEKGKIKNNRFTLNGKNIQVLICEDMWGWDDVYAENPLTSFKPNKTDLVVNLSASPFYLGKKEKRKVVAIKTSKLFKAPVAYVNLVGAQDELIFDGGSFIIDQKGNYFVSPLDMHEQLAVADINAKKFQKNKSINKTEELRQALVMGIQDFVKKVGFEKVHLGLSGGVDSALVTCLAVDALGAKNVNTIYLPSEFSADLSKNLSVELAKNLNCSLQIIPIESVYKETLKSFQKVIGEFSFGLTNENLQSRIRGMLLMTYSNQYKSLLLTTGNKTEYATGYATIYGDMCGALAPLGDLLKHQVYELSKLYAAKKIMPQGIIDREPSAELRPNQKDSDSLPPYNILDKAVDKIVNKKGRATSETEKWLAKQIMQSEFKRWQAAPILKVSEHSFGLGRRFPIAHKAFY